MSIVLCEVTAWPGLKERMCLWICKMVCFSSAAAQQLCSGNLCTSPFCIKWWFLHKYGVMHTEHEFSTVIGSVCCFVHIFCLETFLVSFKSLVSGTSFLSFKDHWYNVCFKWSKKTKVSISSVKELLASSRMMIFLFVVVVLLEDSPTLA